MMPEQLLEPGFLLEITTNTELEETLMDWLLSCSHTQGFSSFPVNGHSSQHKALSLAEQVAGCKQQVRFQIYLDEKNLYQLLDQLKEDFTDSRLHYWVLPVVEKERI